MKTTNESENADISEPDDDGPEEHWVRHRQTGDLGQIVMVDGVQKVKLDRRAAFLREYRPGDWIDEVEKRPLTRYQVAAVSFEADKALCAVMGLSPDPRSWLTISFDDRMAWRDKGPGLPEKSPRQQLWAAITQGLQRFT